MSACPSAPPPTSCDDSVAEAGVRGDDGDARDRAAGPSGGESASGVCAVECASEDLPDRLRESGGREGRECRAASVKNDACGGDDAVTSAQSSEESESGVWLASDVPPSPEYLLRDA